MRWLGRITLTWGVFFILGCHGGKQSDVPERASQRESAERGRAEGGPRKDVDPPEAIAAPGPCAGAPAATQVLADAERAHEFARKVDEYLKHLSLPPPRAPYTVDNVERWIAQTGQPWFDAQTRRVTELEGTLAEFPEGTFGHARATVSIAGAWTYLAKRRPSIPGEAQKKYDVRMAYYGDWPRHGEGSLNEHAERWVEKARRLASEWGMFQIGVDRPWLSQNAGMFLRQPFPAPTERDVVSPLLPGSVSREVVAPEWPTSARDVLELGQFGLTPRQLACARRYESEPGVKLAMGRYFTTRALLFRDSGALSEAQRLLSEENSPESVVDRGLLMWLEGHGSDERHDEGRLLALFDLLPPGHLSRRRLYLNIHRGFGGSPRALDAGPPESDLPSSERQIESESIEPGFSPHEPRKDFSWWTPAPQPEGSGAGRVEGMRAELDDGSHVFIPYGDDGLDLCAMVLVAPDGQRSPHRPPDVAQKCAARWQE